MIRVFWPLLALLFLLPSPSLTEEPARLPLTEQDIATALRSDWYGVYLQGKKVGYCYVALTRKHDGRFLSRLDLFLKVQSLGVTSESRYVEELEFESAVPYRLSRGRLSQDDGKSRQEIEVFRKGDAFDAVILAAGERTTRRIPVLNYDLTDRLGPTPWIRRGPKPGDQLITRGLLLSELTVHDEIRKYLTARTSVVDGVKLAYHEVEVTLPKFQITGVERLDAQGRLLSGQAAGVFEQRLEPERQAKDLQTSVDLFVLGTVKIDQPLGDPAKIARLVLSVAGDDGGILRSGPRQTVERNPDGSITLKTGDGHGSLEKASPREVAEALAETPQVPVQHPKVQALARQAVGPAQTPHDKVERIVRFVAAHIKPSYTAQPLTLLDLLAQREGDCTEYALLVTALCRAAGIPARDVSGLIYMGDDVKAFGPHTWNEVVLDGVWVPVDASWDELTINPCHIRLVTQLGDFLNLMATFGKLRFKLLEVERK